MEDGRGVYDKEKETYLTAGDGILKKPVIIDALNCGHL